MKTNCIMCPLGCELTITKTKAGVKVTGNSCPRGEAYGISEVTNPVRNFSSLVRVGEDKVVPVKTSAPVKKELIPAMLKEIAKVNLTKMPPIGTVVIENCLGSGASIVTIGY